MAQKSATVARGQTAKHAATPAKKHVKAAAKGGKHHPAPKKSHLTLQQEVHKLVVAEIDHLAHLAKPKKAQAKKKPAAKTKARGWTPDGPATCAVDALAWSLRLAGGSVDATDVLELFTVADGDPVAGLTVVEVLSAAQEHGLAGAYPVWSPAARLGDGVVVGADFPFGSHTVTLDGSGCWSWDEWHPVRGLTLDDAWVVTWQ